MNKGKKEGLPDRLLTGIRSAGKQESAAGGAAALLEAYAMDQRVGMPMHLPPL